jgi:SAM-dependent methyltransferase
LNRQLLQLIRYTSNKLKSASVRLTKWTGKSSVYIHPKHLNTPMGDYNWLTNTLEKTDKVLDIGCGTLAHSIRAAQRTKYVASFDYSVELLNRNQQQLAEREIDNIGLFQANAEYCLPFADKMFDKVILLDLLEHIYNRDLILSEVHRVLTDDGLMYLAIPNIDTKWKRRYKKAGLFYYTDPDHKIEYTKETLADELKRNSFVVKGDYDFIVYDTPWVGLIDFIGGFSISLYQMLNRQRYKFLLRHPEDTTGWRVICEKIT